MNWQGIFPSNQLYLLNFNDTAASNLAESMFLEKINSSEFHCFNICHIFFKFQLARSNIK